MFQIIRLVRLGPFFYHGTTPAKHVSSPFAQLTAPLCNLVWMHLKPPYPSSAGVLLPTIAASATLALNTTEQVRLVLFTILYSILTPRRVIKR